MNRIKYLLPLLVIMVILAGCPYKSAIPLDATGKKINTALLGKWEERNSTSTSFKVSKESETTYRIVKTSKDSKDSTVYKGYLVDLDGDSFLNLWEENGSSEKSYYIYKVEVNSGASKVTMTGVTENITEKFTTSDEMKAFFKKYKGLSFFYDKNTESYIKD